MAHRTFYDKKHVPAFFDLFEAATAALEVEDTLLREAIRTGQPTKGGYANVAHGLSYWLFETTLVYFVFRAWVMRSRVAWEHAVGPKATRANEYVEGRRGASEKCDLMLLDEHDKPRAAFEAKWWNCSAGDKPLMNDANKLRRNCADLDKYILAFWWSVSRDGSDHDIKTAAEFCERNGLCLVYVGTFDTQLANQTEGCFSLGVIAVPHA